MKNISNNFRLIIAHQSPLLHGGILQHGFQHLTLRIANPSTYDTTIFD